MNILTGFSRTIIFYRIYSHSGIQQRWWSDRTLPIILFQKQIDPPQRKKKLSFHRLFPLCRLKMIDSFKTLTTTLLRMNSNNL